MYKRNTLKIGFLSPQGASFSDKVFGDKLCITDPDSLDVSLRALICRQKLFSAYCSYKEIYKEKTNKKNKLPASYFKWKCSTFTLQRRAMQIKMYNIFLLKSSPLLSMHNETLSWSWLQTIFLAPSKELYFTKQLLFLYKSASLCQWILHILFQYLLF